MHDDQIDTTPDLVRRLIETQFPHWIRLAIRPVADSGTDHALYRLGDDLVVRLPIVESAVDQVESDRRWLPVLAQHLTLPVPIPVAVGHPGEGYPWPWLVVPWIDGETPTATNLDLATAAVDLAAFIRALHAIDPTGGPPNLGTWRGAPIQNLDDTIRPLIHELRDEIDATAVTHIWDNAVSAPVWQDPLVWIHADISPGNLIVRHRRLAAVIDFGGLGLGDPAPDLVPAWKIFDPQTRTIFQNALGYDDATWTRAKGWLLAPALQGLRYYRKTRPDFVATAQHEINTVLAALR